MIKLKNILIEAGVFDSPETYSTEPPKFTQTSTADDLSGDASLKLEPPYDGVLKAFKALSEEEQQSARKALEDKWSGIVEELTITANILYADNGLYAEVQGLLMDPVFAKSETYKKFNSYMKSTAALNKQAMELEMVLRTFAPDGDMDKEHDRLIKYRKTQAKDYIEYSNNKIVKQAKNDPAVQKSEKEAVKQVEDKSADYVDQIVDSLMKKQIELGNIEPPATAQQKIWAQDIAKANKSFNSYIAKYGDNDEEDTKELLKKLQQRMGGEEETKEGMIKLKPLVEAGNDIDLSKVFMKGVGPGGEPNPDQLTDEPKAEKEIESALKDLDKEINRADLEPKKVDEALGLTLAGIALSMPAIISLIGKFVNLLQKIPFLKSLSGDKLIALGDKWHHKITGGFEYIIKKAGVKDSVKAKKFANILHHTIIAILLVAGGVAGYQALSKGNIAGATMKGALNAVKSNELHAFLVKAAAGI